MRIAFLILAHDNPLSLTRLLKSLSNDHFHIFLHVDKKSKMAYEHLLTQNVSIIKKRISVEWGSYSIVEATLSLTREAVSFNDFDYYVLLSGTSYPIKTNEDILDFFQKHKNDEFIDLFEMPRQTKTLSRIQYFYSRTVTRYFFFFIKIIMDMGGVKRKFPSKVSWMRPYAGAQWWALSGHCIKYILKFVEENPSYVDFFRTTLIPDEAFFQTLIGNSEFKKQVKFPLVYMDWFFNNFSPAFISKNHLRVIQAMKDRGDQFLFARKIKDDNLETVNLIDKFFLLKLQNLTGGLQEKVAPNKKARAPYQNALLWFWANLSRFPFPLKVELILLKIRVLMGLALDSRARYLDQVFDLLINLDGVLVSSDSRGGRNRPAIIIDPKPAADGVSAMSKILYVVENNLPLFNLIVEKQKVDCKSILRIVNIEQDSNYSTLLFKLNFENSRITVLRSDEAHSFDGIMHSMKNSEGQNIDIFKIDIKNWCDYLWKDEIAAKFFLSKTKFISIRIPNMEGMRQRLYALLGDSGFDFSTKGDLTIGYNKNLLPRIF